MTKEQIDKFIVVNECNSQIQKIYEVVSNNLLYFVVPKGISDDMNTLMTCEMILHRAKERVGEAFEQAIAEMNNLIKEI